MDREELLRLIDTKEIVLSYSSLSQFHESPLHFMQYKLKQFIETDAMIKGTLVHCLVLEPDEVEDRYHIIEDVGDKRTKANKDRYFQLIQEFETEQESRRKAGKKEKILIEKPVFDHAIQMANAVKLNSASRRLLNQIGETEKKVEWVDYNFKHRGVIDGIGEIILDLKTCADASPQKFQRDVIYMDYHLQAAMYTRAARYSGIKDIDYYVIAVDGNFGVSCHKIDERLIKYSEELHKLILQKFNQCAVSNLWNSSYEFWGPEKSRGIYTLEKPGWMLNEL